MNIFPQRQATGMVARGGSAVEAETTNRAGPAGTTRRRMVGAAQAARANQ